MKYSLWCSGKLPARAILNSGYLSTSPVDCVMFGHRVDARLLTEVEEYDAIPSEAASYGKTAFWDERYGQDEEVCRA